MFKTDKGIVIKGDKSYLVDKVTKDDLRGFYIAHYFFASLFVLMSLYVFYLGVVNNGFVKSLVSATIGTLFSACTLAYFIKPGKNQKIISIFSSAGFILILLIMIVAGLNHVGAISFYISIMMVYLIISSIPKQKGNLFKIIRVADEDNDKPNRVFTKGIIIKLI